MKGIKKALCLLVLLFSVALALPVTAKASTNGHTAQEALAWARAQVGKSLDYDGVYGAQCVDLIKYYYDFLGCASYARGNGCDYATNALPSGWARYQGAQPQPGDILVYSGNASTIEFALCSVVALGEFKNFTTLFNCVYCSFNPCHCE